MQCSKWYETFSPVYITSPSPQKKSEGRAFKNTPGREWLYTQARNFLVDSFVFYSFDFTAIKCLPCRNFFNSLITGSQVASDRDCLLLRFCMGVLKWLLFRSQKFSGKKFKRTGSRLSARSLIKFFFSNLWLILPVNNPTHMYLRDLKEYFKVGSVFQSN